MTSIYGSYFWPTTGDGFLLNASLPSFSAVLGIRRYWLDRRHFGRVLHHRLINAGIVSAGINAFYTQLAFGLVIVVSVVLQTIIERRIRRQSLTGR